MSFFSVQKYPKFFGFLFCQNANKTAGQNIQNPKNRLPKSCPLSEPQELEVRICVQPNFPITILILLNRFHKFHRSRVLNSCDSSVHHEIRYVDPFHQNINVSVRQWGALKFRKPYKGNRFLSNYSEMVGPIFMILSADPHENWMRMKCWKNMTYWRTTWNQDMLAHLKKTSFLSNES